MGMAMPILVQPKKSLDAIGERFMTLPGEKLIFVQRKHWFSFVFPLISLTAVYIVSILGLIIASSLFLSYIELFLSLGLFITILTATSIGKFIVDWYFNFFVITSKKLIEVSHRPLTSRHTNEILLDQVKCTEIDTRIEGAIHELLDIGDVIITFDRPTHQEEFVLPDMSNPKKIETKLENALSQVIENSDSSASAKTTWFVKEKEKTDKWRYLEEIGLRRTN